MEFKILAGEPQKIKIGNKINIKQNIGSPVVVVMIYRKLGCSGCLLLRLVHLLYISVE